MSENSNSDIVAFVAKRIDYLRIEYNYSIRELAKRSGISHNSLFSIIQGKKAPNIYTLNSICSALRVSLSDFFNQDENVLILRGKENLVIKIFREVSPMSQDTVIKVLKCMK